MLNLLVFPRDETAYLRRVRVWLVAGNLIIAATLLLLLVAWQSSLLTRARDAERSYVQTVSLSISQTIESQLAQVDLGLQSAMLRLQGISANGTARGPQINAVLREQLALMPYLEDLHLVDAQGLIRYGGDLNPAMRMDISGLAHFQRVRSADANTLVVSEPVVSMRSKHHVLVSMRRLAHADGSFAGALSGLIDVDRFHQLFGSVKLDAVGAISLRTDTLQLVARVAAGQVLAPEIGSNKVSAELVQVIARQPQNGSYISATALDGIERINAYHKVGIYPLTVIVGRGTETFMQPWRTQLVQVGAMGALAMAIMVVLSVMVFQSIQREFRGRSQMEHALQQSQALLQASPDGIHVLDTTGTIVSVNAAFASLLGYHPDYLQGRHLDVITDLALADLAPLEPYATGAAPRRLLAQYRRYDGSQLTVEVLSTRVAADSGSLIYCSARAIAQNDRGLSSGLLTAYVFNQRDVP